MLNIHVLRSRPPMLAASAEVKKIRSLTDARAKPITVELPDEALQLKQLICKKQPTKLYAFSLSHMRKTAMPPVEIPPSYRSSLTKSILVGGHQVPYTRDMWNKSKRRVVRRRLDRIHEYITYD